MNRKILTLAVLLAVAPTMSSAASVYKWTDEEGVTHFGDRQPTGQQAESVSIRTGKRSENNRQSPQERVEALENREAENAERQKETAQEEARRKQREANCETARSNLSILKRNSRIRVEEDGEQRYLSEEEIEEQRKKFEEIAEENCGEPSGD
ncbi:DUF4124 domain-containing protein [Marinobacter sp. TBZ242]|uniref:DUF4124 domain-containing protein n=1 Tax=Marinobacter azerbaijanicus TaxID=3050455 RepID=A0ABT7IGY5_9GAMM|nr:DUF4124 domain-containing protein [Marinobacter sp. TBZ242]MDL0433427.1 DUF4124 domain-containing protein [Marinobacter sp. TBZ242]